MALRQRRQYDTSKSPFRLSAEELERTIDRWIQYRDHGSKNKLTYHYWFLVKKIARRLARRHHLPAQETFSVGLECMLNGFDIYDAKLREEGIKLTTVVCNQVRWRGLRKMHELIYRVQLPGYLAQNIKRAMRKLNLLEPLSRTEMEQVAEHLQTSYETVKTMLLAMSMSTAGSEIPRNLKTGFIPSLEETLEFERPNPEEFANRYTVRNTITRALLTLKPREERVLRLRCGFNCDELTFEEIGELYSITRERVRQIELKALRKLKHPSRSRKLRNPDWDYEIPYGE